MKRRYIILLAGILFGLFFYNWFVNFTPFTYGHKLLASKTFTDTPYNTSEVLNTLEENGWSFSARRGKSYQYIKEDRVDLRFTPSSVSQFAINIMILGKNEKRNRERLNQTLDELHQVFGWDVSGFDISFSVESD